MKAKHLDIEIPKENPFANCKLDRKKYADILTNVIETYADGFVLAVNNEWGAGKTTFLKMWQQELENKEYKTLYFNAWENDFDSNALVAIMSELKSIMPKDSDDSTFKPLLKKGAVMAKSVLPSVFKAIAEKYISTEVITEAIKNTAEAATEILKDEIDEYAKKKKGLLEFRKEVEKFVVTHSTTKPLVFIVDELDRCKPDYAIEVLEYLKHFFNVPGIIFILSIDKFQLANAVKGFYGNDKINGHEYLRRFIDIEYNLPIPPTDKFCNYLFDYFGFSDFFHSNRTLQSGNSAIQEDLFLRFSTILFEKSNLNLRQQEKIYSHSRVALTLSKNTSILPPLFIFLNYLKIQDPLFYKQISKREIILTELGTQLSARLPYEIDSQNNENLVIRTEALFIYLYFNYYRKLNYKLELIGTNNEKQFLAIGNYSSEKGDRLLQVIKTFESSGIYGLELSYFLDIIDLTNKIN